MKNLPERDFWKDVGNRLDAYKEEPDDTSWDKIATAISPQREPKGLVWIDRFAGMALLIYISFMAGYSVARNDFAATRDRDVAVSPSVEITSGSERSVETNDPDQFAEETDSRTAPMGPSPNNGDGGKRYTEQALTGTDKQTSEQAQLSEGSASSLRSPADSNEDDLKVTAASDTRRKRSADQSLTDAHSQTPEQTQLSERSVSSLKSPADSNEGDLKVTAASDTGRKRSADQSLTGAHSQIPEQTQLSERSVSSLKSPADSNEDDLKVTAASDTGRKKSGDQSLTGAHSQTSEQAQLSEGAASSLRSHADSNEDDSRVTAASDKTHPVNGALREDKNGDNEQEKKSLSGASTFTSAGEGTQSGTASPDAVMRGNTRQSTTTGFADPVMDSLAVKKIVRKDSAAARKEAAPKAPAKKKQKIYPQLYVTLTPSLSFQKITPEQTDGVNVRGMRSPGILAADRFGISLEAGLQRKLTKHLEVYTGISYYQQKQDLVYEYLSPDEVEVTSSANGQYTVRPKMETREFKYNMVNAGVSAGLFYRIKGEKLMHKLGGGIQYQKGLLRSGSEDTYDNAGSSYLNYQVSYRVEYLLNAKVNIFVQPAFTHSFYAKEKLAEPFTIKPYRAGIGFGMIYHF